MIINLARECAAVAFVLNRATRDFFLSLGGDPRSSSFIFSPFSVLREVINSRLLLQRLLIFFETLFNPRTRILKTFYRDVEEFSNHDRATISYNSKFLVHCFSLFVCN